MNKKIKVANVIEEGRWGGPQVRITSVAKYLTDKIDTTVILPAINSERFVKELDNQNIHYQLFPLNRVSTGALSIVKYALTFFIEVARLSKYFSSKKFDIIHISGGATQYKGVIAGWLSNTKVIWHLNDTYSPWVVRYVFSKVCLLSSGFIFASQSSRHYYKKLLPDNSINSVIQAPVNTAEFNPEKTFVSLGCTGRGTNNRLVIGIIANISNVKGIEHFIRAASIVNQQYENAHFIIAGDIFESQQLYFKSLKQLCDELSINNLEFIGAVLDVRPLLKKFDIYVCSSNFESSPISVWEAMAMEKPIVSTDVGDVPVYIENGVNGFVVDVGNFNDIADRLLTLIGDKQLRIDFGRRARIKMLNNLDISKCAERHLSAYKKINNL